MPDMLIPPDARPFWAIEDGSEYTLLDRPDRRYRKINAQAIQQGDHYPHHAPDPWLLVLPVAESAPGGDYHAARGAVPWRAGDPPAEVLIRRVRDGVGAGRPQAIAAEIRAAIEREEAAQADPDPIDDPAYGRGYLSGLRMALQYVMHGGREKPADPPDPNVLGDLVRKAWMAWARTQPAPKAAWLVPYAALDAADQEADRQIGLAVWRYARGEG